MPANSRYNTLNRESKQFQNILKIICYLAATAMVKLLTFHYKKSLDEGLMLQNFGTVLGHKPWALVILSDFNKNKEYCGNKIT